MLIKQIPSKDTYPLRIKILRKGITKNYEFKEDILKTSIHLGAYINNQCIGILTLIKKEFPRVLNSNTYQLRGMAIDEAYQKQGIGKELVLESFSILQNKKVEMIWCNARIHAVDFYKKLGFKTKGEAFEIPSIGLHYKMIKELDLYN